VIGFIADLHIDNHAKHGGVVRSGINARCGLCLGVVEAARRRAETLAVSHLFVLGDVFHTVRPLPQIITAVQQALHSEGHETIYLVGNHDRVSTATGDHSLGPLAADGAKIVEEPTVLRLDGGQVEVWCVPSLPGNAEERLPSILTALAGEAASLNPASERRRLLVLHFGISDDETAPFLRAAQDAVSLKLLKKASKKFGFTAILAGNWHPRKEWHLSDGCIVVQVGALCPIGWGDPGLDGYGSLVTYDPAADSLGVEELPGPRFVTVRKGDKPLPMTTASRLFVRRIVEEDEHFDAGTLPDNVSLEVVSSETDSQIAARAAQQAVRAAGTVEEAIAAYIAEMPLPDGVARDAVAALVRDLMTSAEAEA
jgi:DNA repair exonuclease SbcCD nuclease subunit